MKKIIVYSTYFGSLVYILVGVFGYLSFANKTQEITDISKSGVIIMANYGNRWEVIIVVFIIIELNVIRYISILCFAIVY